MKMKKIMSAIVAGAMTMTTFAAMSASAAVSSKEIYGGTTVLESDWSTNVQIASADFMGFSGDVTVDVALADVNVGAQIQLKYVTSDWKWKDLTSVADVSGDSVSFDLTADDLALVLGGNNLIVGGANATVTSVTVTGEYEAVTFDAWVDNGDGTYTFNTNADSATKPTKGNLLLDLSKYTDADYADITKITVHTSLGGGFANGTLGLNNAAGDWTAIADGAEFGNDFVLETEGVEAGQKLQVQLWWVNKGSSISVTGVEVEAKNTTPSLVPGQIYTQSTAVENGKFASRYVVMVPEADALNAKAVEFTLNNGTKDAKVTSYNYYTSITANGETLTPDEGYVFVTCAVKGIPESVSVECTGYTLK
ncbi:MAG: hypothetical protein J5994_11370 [Ruminococcus sp.]|nr:hypothetical protein [Ruminococcus sp.]